MPPSGLKIFVGAVRMQIASHYRRTRGGCMIGAPLEVKKETPVLTRGQCAERSDTGRGRLSTIGGRPV